MKILQVFAIFSPQVNGTVKLLYQLSEALMKREHEVVIYASDYKSDQEYANSLPRVKVYPFRSWLNLLGLYLMPGMIAATRKGLKDFDVIHLHCLRSFQNIVLHHYAVKYGMHYVLDTHGSLPRRHGEKSLKWLLRWLFDITYGYRILRDASKVIAETELGVNEYKEFGVNQDKIVLIPPPFAVDNFARLPAPGLFRQEYDVKEKGIVLFLGRINWIKGLDFLVESFNELAKSRSDVILVIVGNDDGYKPTLDKLIRELDLSDKILFTGFLDGAAKLAALVDADVVVQTSRYEQGAWAPFEAVLCNTPIIVSNNSGAGEDVKKIDAGYLVEYGNKGQLRDMIQYVLEHPAEAREKTQKAKEYIKSNLSLKKGVEKYEELYREVSRRYKK
ncbi:MAG: glycosyltransferase family 4 protein [Chloroflexi bacterium]|nr:glycosyltransferase family 4 protein [Chloroflexota bacterium]